MIVVLDTNVWMSNLFLRTDSSAALKLYLRKSGVKVGLPEVIKLEVERHLEAELQKRRSRLLGDHSDLLSLVGDLKELVLPDVLELNAKARTVFDDIGVSIEVVPFTAVAAREAFLRTIDKVPPSKNSQQFKDGVIWHDVKTLAQSDEVILVTSDKEFYQGQRYENGLASELREEAERLPHPVRLLSSFIDLLTEFRSPLSVNVMRLAVLVEHDEKSGIQAFLRNEDLTMETVDVNYRAFATEQTGMAYIEYTVNFTCSDPSIRGRTECRIMCTGGCSVSVDSGEFGRQTYQSTRATYVENGEEVSRGNVFLHASLAIFGHREVSRTVRYPLDN